MRTGDVGPIGQIGPVRLPLIEQWHAAKNGNIERDSRPGESRLIGRLSRDLGTGADAKPENCALTIHTAIPGRSVERVTCRLCQSCLRICSVVAVELN